MIFFETFTLTLSHDTVIIPLVMFGYFFCELTFFHRLILMTLVSMLYSFSLKNLFQIPLQGIVAGQGYAFPSGHMLTSIIFYGMIFQKSHSLLIKSLAISCLSCIGGALISTGYHNLFEISGAIFFGILFITIINQLLPTEISLSRVTLFFLSMTLILMWILYSQHALTTHMILTSSSLIGFCSSSLLTQQKRAPELLVVTKSLCFILSLFIVFALKMSDIRIWLIGLITGATLPLLRGPLCHQSDILLSKYKESYANSSH